MCQADHLTETRAAWHPTAHGREGGMRGLLCHWFSLMQISMLIDMPKKQRLDKIIKTLVKWDKIFINMLLTLFALITACIHCGMDKLCTTVTGLHSYSCKKVTIRKVSLEIETYCAICPPKYLRKIQFH